jgi:hypothetical protein
MYTTSRTTEEVMRMTVNEILTAIMNEKGISKAQLGRAVGIEDKKNPSDVINKRMKQSNISVNVLEEMLSAMGYTIVVVPSGPKLKDGEYEVSVSE